MAHSDNAAEFRLSSKGTIPWDATLPAGLVPIEVHFGRDEDSTGAAQVAVVRASIRPTKALLEAVWKTRGAHTTAPVLVVAVYSEGVWLHEHDSDPVGPIPPTYAARRVQSVLDEPDGISAFHQIRALIQAFETPGGGGFTNHFLFAGYHLRTNVPRRPDWGGACDKSLPLLGVRGKQLIEELGYATETPPGASNALVLRSASGQRRALAVLLNESENFDLRSAAYPLSPVARGLELAGREGVSWVILLRKGVLRLYPGTDGVGVGQRGQSETYFELNLDLLDQDDAGYLGLIFSADALERGGSADQILEGSSKFAAELGSRLRDRVYEKAVPLLAESIARRLPERGVALDAEGLQFAYALTLRVLFRILFQAYAEDSGLLPADRNDWFKANSLQAFVERERDTATEDFSADATSIWQDLRQVWDAIYSGNSRWEVPAYGGSLFDPHTEEGKFLKGLDLPDAVVGPALQAILTEETEEGVRGAVDFRSLQVREFGTIYEGLLESSLSVAIQDLTTDKSGAYVPADTGDSVEVRAGEPYFHSASGERKATGSYFTPKIVVDHLIERSVKPTLDTHLAKVEALLREGKEREAADAFWDFRVADLAMGSAHFLVAAIDKVERGMRDFLTINPVPGVMAELTRLAEKAREALGEDTEAAAAITQAQLLRRQVARRCIYGLDINPLAVELSRLAIWIHTFVPGLPMSSLDHGLVLGNSLTGVGSIEEALDALDPKRAPGQATFFDDVILDELAAAKSRLADFAAASEADKAEVAAGAQLLEDTRRESARAKSIFDAAVAVRMGEISRRVVLTEAALYELLEDSRLREVATSLNPAHLPYLFPEVFLRDEPGFDALIGNPPWEEPIFKEDRWWLLHSPGLMGLRPVERSAEIDALRSQRPDLVEQLEKERVQRSRVRAAVLALGLPGVGRGNVDLYQAFAWRYWRLVRPTGRLGIVMPRGVLNGSALAEWRAEVISCGGFMEICLLENRGRWVFDLRDGARMTIALLSMARNASGETAFIGPFGSESELVDGREARATRSAASVASWSPSLALPCAGGTRDVDVLEAMYRHPHFFDTEGSPWGFRPTRGDVLDKGLMQFGGPAQSDDLQVWAGASFNIWDVQSGEPFAFAERAPYIERYLAQLKNARANRKSAHFGIEYSEAQMPMSVPRIATRWISRATDSRTLIAALLPPWVVTVDSASVFVRRKGNCFHEAYVLGVMSSRIFDWQIRKWVEQNVTFEMISHATVPSIDEREVWAGRTAIIAGTLAAVDRRYAEWAEQVGVPVGSVNDYATKNDLIAELDALVSLLYGLSEDQLTHVFRTFHRGWDYQPRLDAALVHYRRWEDKR